MTALELMQAARETILLESNWVQGTAARDKMGLAVWPDHPEAACWCITGAINKVVRPEEKRMGKTLAPLHRHVMGVVAGALPEDCDTAYPYDVQKLVAFNDSRTHAEVIALFDRAIAADHTCESYNSFSADTNYCKHCGVNMDD